MKTEKSTNIDVKRINRNSILRFVFQKESTSRQEIAAALHMSMPTVLQNVNELQEIGIVAEGGQYNSTGGRKASVITPVPGYRYSIGVNITKHHIELLLMNLAGRTISCIRTFKKYENTQTYYHELGDMVCDFVNGFPDVGKVIIGVGVSIPGFISDDGAYITDSHALEIRNIPCSVISDRIPWPCQFLNDANAAGLAELNYLKPDGTMAYLSLSDSVGGAIFIGDELYKGVNGRSGEFGHMRIEMNGNQCYCGQKGCLDAYCSALKLSAKSADGKLETFFEELNQGNDACRLAWEEYLKYLAIAVVNLRMIFDCNVVLGGYVGQWIRPWVDEVRRNVAALNPFEEGGNYIRACGLQRNASAAGAALQPISTFMNGF